MAHAIARLEPMKPTCVLREVQVLLDGGHENGGGVPVEECEAERNAEQQEQPVLVGEDAASIAHERPPVARFCAGLVRIIVQSRITADLSRCLAAPCTRAGGPLEWGPCPIPFRPRSPSCLSTFALNPLACAGRHRPPLTAALRRVRRLERHTGAVPPVRQHVLRGRARAELGAHHLGPGARSDRWRLAESAPKIVANIRSLGFRVEDVKLILNSHVHYDHAGGIAELQKLSGAKVAASARSAPVLTSGASGAGRSAVRHPSADREGRRAFRRLQGWRDAARWPARLTAHLTPGHTPGGTSWTWKSCEAERCLNMVYADSLSPVSRRSFEFTESRDNPHALTDFERATPRSRRSV